MLLSVMVLTVPFSLSVNATPVMPDFADVPTDWAVDRYPPHSFANVGVFHGRHDVLGIGIDESDGLLGRPPGFNSVFYNTQGRQHAIMGGAGSVLSADLYIPLEWEDESHGAIRTDMWGVMTNGVAVSDYAIIGFTNYGGGRLRVWDAGAWTDLPFLVNYNTWMALSIEFTGTSYVYSVHNVPVYTDLTTLGSVGFSAVIMQAYNFCDDPGLSDAVCANYVAHWSNTDVFANMADVSEPATLALLGSGFVGLSRLRRKK